MEDFKETGSQLLRVADYSKARTAHLAHSIVESARDGDLIESAAQLKCLGVAVKAAQDMLREDFIEEVSKHGKEALKHGAKFLIKESGVRYSFDQCGDPEWNKLKVIADEAINDLKAREKMLKSFTKPMTAVDEDSGEVVTIYPPQKRSTTIVEVTLAKDDD